MKLNKLFVCVFCAACLFTGCGSDGEPLSELRQEKADDPGSETFPEERTPEEENAEGGAEAAGDAGSEETGGERADEREPAPIYVHVCGAVECPGVYEMPAGSRFYEAVETAGGFAEDACRDYLNMAAPLADGSRLEIPTTEDIRAGEAIKDTGDTEYSYYTVPEAPATQNERMESAEAGLVNINTADIAGLCALPGVGEGRAKAIVEYREKQGGFRKKEDIMEVSGIGEKMYARMEAYLTVE